MEINEKKSNNILSQEQSISPIKKQEKKVKCFLMMTRLEETKGFDILFSKDQSLS